ncbi:MAG: peptide chain release factor N(5)-glutamine methyltransferase [Burkholderiales bacterium]
MNTTVSEALAQTRQRIDTADARALLCHALSRDAAWLITHANDALDDALRERFEQLARRRATGEPVAYLTGEREFYSLPFKVTPAVLIPRPETELLVEATLECIPMEAPCRVLDLATGSGCVAVAIAQHRPRARVTATDVSRAALAVARDNAARHGVSIELVESDWFFALGAARFEAIVANPPYIAESDPHLNEGDLRFEPRATLVAGPTGLECIELIIEQAARYLTAGGWLLFEHGFDQGVSSRALLAAAGYGDIATRRDLAGVERVSSGRV